MDKQQSLSDLWRENRSKDPGADLASILDGARIIAQSLNPKVEVVFAGVQTAETDMKRIYLSPRDLGTEYPVPGDAVDCILGLTVHEVGHTLFSEDKVKFLHKLERSAKISTNEDYKPFVDLVNVFEDIYVNHLMTAYPGYRDYLQREMAHSLGVFNPDGVTKPLEASCTRKDMLNAMVYLTLAGGKMPQSISQENVKTLGKMATLANKMCTKKTSKTTAIILAWNALKELPTTLSDEDRGFGEPAPAPDTGESKPAPEQVQEDAENDRETQEKLEKQEGLEEETEEDEDNGKTESEEEGDEKGQDTGEEEQGTGENEEEAENVETEPTNGAEGDIGEEEEDREDIEPEIEPDPNLDLSSGLNDLVDDDTRLPKDLAEEVSEAIVEKRADLSELLSYIAKDSYMTILAYTPPEDAKRAADARSKTSFAEEKLRRVLQDFRLRRTKDYRGLMAGRISSRRLHRVSYGDQRVFQRRDRPEEIDMAICLLMDLSGSVHYHRPLIEQITCAICDAFQKEKVEFIALGYSEAGNTAYIPRLYDRESQKVKLGLDKEWHSTPSYEGLAAAIAQLLRLTGKKQKVLFHFTDGQPTSGRADIPELLKDARAKGITDIHVCLARESGLEKFKYLYGEGAMMVEDINQLPDIVDQELRKRLKI